MLDAELPILEVFRLVLIVDEPLHRVRTAEERRPFACGSLRIWMRIGNTPARIVAFSWGIAPARLKLILTHSSVYDLIGTQAGVGGTGNQNFNGAPLEFLRRFRKADPRLAVRRLRFGNQQAAGGQRTLDHEVDLRRAIARQQFERNRDRRVSSTAAPQPPNSACSRQENLRRRRRIAPEHRERASHTVLTKMEPTDSNRFRPLGSREPMQLISRLLFHNQQQSVKTA